MATKEEYLSTIEKMVRPAEEGTGTGSFCEPIRSNAMVTGNLNSQFMYNQSDDGPYQEMSKTSMDNKYLTKIASMENSRLSKIGIGLSGASLGISGLNYLNNKATKDSAELKANLERKSLNALNDINKSLSTAQLVHSPVSNNISMKKV